jgi:NADH-quinone oxidoreductase subunit H
MASFLDIYVWPTLLTVGYILLIIVPLLLCVAYLTYAERKVMAAVQIRRGPNVVGPGLLQPLADGVKLVFKETIIPTTANRVVFMVAPMITFVLALVAWAVIPFDAGVVLANINVGVLYLFAISSLGVYGVIMAGWASNSKYPFLGALRSAAQMVSYEVSIGFVIITVLLAAHSLNLSAIIESQRGDSGYFWNWYAFGMLAPMAVIFFISALAETNRVPFDLPEGESELVAGFFAEYSSMSFGLFFLGEYANIILMSTTTSLFFLGGWLPPFPFVPFTWIPGWIWFLLKVLFVVFLFLLVRATFPRYRYDQVMRLGWKVFIPVTLVWIAFLGAMMQTRWAYLFH